MQNEPETTHTFQIFHILFIFLIEMIDDIWAKKASNLSMFIRRRWEIMMNVLETSYLWLFVVGKSGKNILETNCSEISTNRNPCKELNLLSVALDNKYCRVPILQHLQNWLTTIHWRALLCHSPSSCTLQHCSCRKKSIFV